MPNVAYTFAFDGTLTRLSDLNEGLENRLNVLQKRKEEQPEWMLRTTSMNVAREKRIAELKVTNPALYVARKLYIAREDGQ
jgi:hypothetical protein